MFEDFVSIEPQLRIWKLEVKANAPYARRNPLVDVALTKIQE